MKIITNLDRMFEHDLDFLRLFLHNFRTSYFFCLPRLCDILPDFPDFPASSSTFPAEKLRFPTSSRQAALTSRLFLSVSRPHQLSKSPILASRSQGRQLHLQYIRTGCLGCLLDVLCNPVLPQCPGGASTFVWAVYSQVARSYTL